MRGRRCIVYFVLHWPNGDSLVAATARGTIKPGHNGYGSHTCKRYGATVRTEAPLCPAGRGTIPCAVGGASFTSCCIGRTAIHSWLQPRAVLSNPDTTGTDHIHTIPTDCEIKTLRGGLGYPKGRVATTACRRTAKRLCCASIVTCSERLLHVVQRFWIRGREPREHTGGDGKRVAIQAVVPLVLPVQFDVPAATIASNLSALPRV